MIIFATSGQWVNSLTPGRSQCHFKNVIFNLALLIGIFKSPYHNVLRWMPQDFTDDKSTLVQVMAWCRQATSRYLNQCWSRSPTPYRVTRPQWVKATRTCHSPILSYSTDVEIPTNILNSLAPGKFEWNFKYLIFQIISVIDGWVISCELALRWMSLDLTDDKSTLVQVMAWCRQATSHYLSQCWPRSLSP